MPITVSTTSGLIAALKGAAAGAVILLSPGTYTGVKISGLNPSGVVTVQAAPAGVMGAPAAIVDFNLSNSSNLYFSGISFSMDAATDPWFPLRLTSLKNVTFAHDDFHGDASKPPGVQPYGLDPTPPIRSMGFTPLSITPLIS